MKDFFRGIKAFDHGCKLTNLYEDVMALYASSKTRTPNYLQSAMIILEDRSMCGRFVGYRRLEELKNCFPIDRSVCEVVSNFNVAPSQEILAITRYDGQNVLDKFHWGLVPFWAKDPSIGNRMINARSETVASKPSFRNAFKQRRCLIPADGFYEWAGPRGNKQPVYITLANKQPIAFAGLWETWYDKQNEGIPYRSCTIITRAACEKMIKIHHRMPAILHPSTYGAWLDPEKKGTAHAQAILENNVLTNLIFHPVSKQVNSVRNNETSNLRPVQIEFDF